MKCYVLLAVVGIVVQTTRAAECQAGTTWRSACQDCACSEQGRASCVEKPCDDPGAERMRCAPRSVFLDDEGCNKCFCSADGLSIACTQMACTKVPKYPKNVKPLPLGRECSVGSTWQNLCNDCICDDQGYPKCTNRKCVIENIMAPDLHCRPDTVWKDDCNTCYCNADGVPICTRIGCVSIPVSDLNFDDGKELKPPGPSNLEAKSAPNGTVCEARKSFRKDCNTCWCNDHGTGFFCTRKVCVPTLDDNDAEKEENVSVIEKQCRPGEVFEVDCNICRCNDNGEAFSCTRRACVTDAPPDVVLYEPKNMQESPAVSRMKRQTESKVKKCEPGSKFRVDCNTCLCHTDGQSFSCTRYDCIATQQPAAAPGASRRRRRREVTREPIDCTPNSVFQHRCNICRCSAGGTHASCTVKRCPLGPSPAASAPAAAAPDTTDNRLSVDPNAAEVETGFRCTPGEQFRRDCNDCTCSADGKSVFCTIKLCDNTSLL